MSAFPKADVQDVGVGTDLNVCLWPKADIRTESISLIVDVSFGGGVKACLLISGCSEECNIRVDFISENKISVVWVKINEKAPRSGH